MLDIFNTKKVKALENRLDAQSSMLNMLTKEQYFNGEKTEGEMGPIQTIFPDYYGARERGWTLQLTNDIAKTIQRKWVTWIIGKGLRFNATPSDKILGSKKENVVSDIEYRFRLHLKSKESDYSKMVSTHTKAATAVYNAKVAGDVLVICRVQKGIVTTQLIDGACVVNPFDYKIPDGNQIIDGVEFNSRDEHVAYHIQTEELKTKRILAKDKRTGLQMAWLMYGSKFRLNETRGLPEMIESYEKLQSMQRYVEATVKKAELSNEIVFVNEHDNSSTGEDVFKSGAAQGLSSKTNKPDPLEGFPTASKFQKNMSRLTKAASLNNTIGAKLKVVAPDSESTMPDFTDANVKLSTASTGMPGEVAMSSYNSNYAASTGARSDFGIELSTQTKNIAIDQFYKPIYNLWLYNEALMGRIDIFEYPQAMAKGDYIAVEDLTGATFTGQNVPSTDPLKLINAIRKATGDETTPYMTNEKATELIDAGDYSEVQAQVTKERTIAVKPMVDPNKQVTEQKTTK